MLLKWITRLAKYVTESRWSRRLIIPFSSYYRIDTDEAEKDIQLYQSLNDFFTRRLKLGSRTVDPDEKAVISPVDGTVSQLGTIERGTLIQAKGKLYNIVDLLGQDEQRAEPFINGNYITIYLSPQNYHRIHASLSGRIHGYAYLPGSLFPVNKIGVNLVSGLFAKNERWITYVDTGKGRMALVKVGAFLVGSVQVGYNEFPQVHGKEKITFTYKEEQPLLQKGDEVGFFQFGSTVICLFEEGMIKLSPDLAPLTPLKMGEKIGELK